MTADPRLARTCWVQSFKARKNPGYFGPYQNPLYRRLLLPSAGRRPPPLLLAQYVILSLSFLVEPTLETPVGLVLVVGLGMLAGLKDGLWTS